MAQVHVGDRRQQKLTQKLFCESQLYRAFDKGSWEIAIKPAFRKAMEIRAEIASGVRFPKAFFLQMNASQCSWRLPPQDDYLRNIATFNQCATGSHW